METSRSKEEMEKTKKEDEEEEEISTLRWAAGPTDTKKQRKTKEKADELGVCLIGKRVRSKVVPVCSGGLLKGLFPCARENLYITASGDAFPSEDSSEWQNYILYFQRWDSDKPYDNLKEYALPDVRKSEEDIKFIDDNILIIPIDPEKLGKGSFRSFVRRCGSSGMLTYRPFPVEFEEYATGSLAGSVCQIVDGDTSGFSVKTFDLKYMNGKYVLKLPEEGDAFNTLRELTGGGSRHPRGAVILRRQENQRSSAVAVLKFVDDQICPVLLSQIISALLSGITNNQKEKEDDKSAVETEHEEEEGKAPTDHKALSGNGERRSSKDAVAVQNPAHDASAVHSKAPPIVTGRMKNAPKPNNAAMNLDGMTSNEASGQESGGDRSLDEVVIEPESNNKTPVTASAGQGDDKVLLRKRNRSLDQAPQHQAALTVEATQTATAPERAVQEDNRATAPKFENHINRVHGNLLIGDHNNATIGANSSINEPQRLPAQKTETPGAAIPGPSVAPQHQSAPAKTPEGAAPEPSVRHANNGPRTKFVIHIQEVGPDGNVIIGDHNQVNIESSSGRLPTGGLQARATRGSSGP